MGTDRSRRLSVEVRIEVGSHAVSARIDSDAPAVAIDGPSGAGKSTVLRVLAGVESRASGSVRLGDAVWQDSAAGVWVPPWERGVGWVPQEVLLFPHLSVRENLAYGAAPGTDEREVAELLRIAPLLDRRPRRLSGGERQRVALGRALLRHPSLLLLDEPFSALDRPLRAEVSEVVRGWVSEHGIPLVIVSHDETDARLFGDERFTMSDGELRPFDGNGA